MRDALAAQGSFGEHPAAQGGVSLDKEKKKAVSLSLRMSVIRKIDRLAMRMDINRSEAVAKLVETCIDEMMKKNPI